MEIRGKSALVVGGASGMARATAEVLVREGAPLPGGGARTQELTLPGFQHDVCSSVHPLGAASPFFRTIPLERLGASWILPSAQLAHPLDDGRVAVLERSLDATASTLGPDGGAWLRLLEPLVARWSHLMEDVLAPPRWPPHPLLMARFGVNGIRSAAGLARGAFRGDAARALFAGIAAHSGSPLGTMPTAAFGLILAVAGHVVGWPFARGGSRVIIDALASHLQALGERLQASRARATGGPASAHHSISWLPCYKIIRSPAQKAI